MSEGDRPKTRPRAWLKAAWVILAVAFALYWPLRTEYLYEEDSVNFAFGALEFDFALGHPHPPGYPLWILMAGCLTRIVGTPNDAMILLSIGFTTAAGVFLYLLASRLQGWRAGAFVVGLFLFTPNVMLHSAMATTYTVDLFAASFVGWLSAQLCEGRKDLAAWGAAAIGLLGGVRLAGVVFTFPLFLCALVVAFGRDWRPWLKTGLACAAGVACWFFPAAFWGQGIGPGIRDFWDCNQWLWGWFVHWSVFVDHPGEAMVDRLARVEIWYAMSLIVPLCLLACLVAIRKTARIPVASSASDPIWHRGWFYAVWLLPNLLSVCLFYCSKPCYVNLSLPPLILLLGSALWMNARALENRAGARCRWPIPLTFGLFLAASMTLATFPFHKISSPRFAPYRYTVQIGSLQNLRESDRALGELIALAEAETGPGPTQMFIPTDPRWTKLSWDEICYYLPGYPVEELSPSPAADSAPVVPHVKKIWWILPRDAPSDSIRAALPETRLLLRGRFTSFYCSDVALTPLDLDVPVGKKFSRLRRNVAVQLGPGFREVAGEKPGSRSIWSTGREIELRIALARSMPIRLLFDFSALPGIARRIEASLNDQPAEVVAIAASGAQVPLTFEGRKGVNELRLILGDRRGSPADLPAKSPQKAAATIRISAGNELDQVILVP